MKSYDEILYKKIVELIKIYNFVVNNFSFKVI
uniref:Uncharacterized protein n=1 Tax=Arundo donax TaxID=35708 RepID=A0A0A9AV36_ARUDO